MISSTSFRSSLFYLFYTFLFTAIIIIMMLGEFRLTTSLAAFCSLTAAAASIGTTTTTTTTSTSFSPLRPPAIPLAVRSPYLSTWQQAGSDGGNGGYLAGQWPSFWRGQQIGWTGLISVDNTAYVWLGAPDVRCPLVQQTAFEYTSTRSIFTMNVANKVGMNITFLSPVEPEDMLRASLPYSYLNVDVYSIDGAQHTVSIYTDVTAEWASGNRSAVVEWGFGLRQHGSVPQYPAPTSTASNAHASSSAYAYRYSPNEQSAILSLPGLSDSGIAYHQFYRQTQLAFSEIDEQTEYGNWYYTTQDSDKLTFQSGPDSAVRAQYLNHGYLLNANDTNYRAIKDGTPTFAFAVDHGVVGESAVNTLFQISLHQEAAIQFLGSESDSETLPSLWTSYFSSDVDAVSFFYNDYDTAVSHADALDEKIASDSLAVGGESYVALTSLATRQAFGSIEWTNTPSEPLIFMKEISSDGNINTVDVIFPFHPIAIYLNPKLLKYLLDPLYINSEAGHWPHTYTIHDIGSAFPNATGHADGNAEDQPLEECGNMLIMTLAYAQRANDNAYLAEHYPILTQWTAYLVNDSLIPANQISTDDFAGPLANQTNLAIKGIIGIEAFAQIANRTAHVADGINYTQIAHSYISQWQTLAIAQNADLPHTTLSYGQNSTHGLLYNLFADKELGLELVPQSVYDMQSEFYPTVLNTYGVPLDTRHNYTKSDWELFAAAVASKETKDLIINTIATWTGVTPSNLPWTDLYDTTNGDFASQITFGNRPVVGGIFAPLALLSAPSSGYVTPAKRGLPLKV